MGRIFFVLLLVLLPLIYGLGLADAWQYEWGGSWWRVFSCHFVHDSAMHLLLNMGSLVALYSLFPQLKNDKYLVFYLLLGILGISSFIVFSSMNKIFLGFSGLTYTLLTAASLRYLKVNSIAPWVLAFVIIKLGYEQWQGRVFLDIGEVAIFAHLAGALSGLLGVALVTLYQRRVGLKVHSLIANSP
jgi:rhomboid family GlyGly-CTERM serine protease